MRDRGQFLLGGVGAEHDAVPAGALDGFDDQLVDAVEHLLALLVEPAPEGVDVGQQRLLAEVVLDDRRHVGVDELVVADAVAHGAGDHDVACAGGVEDPGHAEHRVGLELHRVEVVVVDAPVDDVDLTLALGGAHVDGVVAAEQVAALDQFHAHLPGQQRVLEVGRVVDARGEHDDGRVGLVGGRGVAQRPQQMRRVVADRAHPVGGEQVREDPRHRAAVLHHVGDARRRAQVVLEHAERALRVAHQVDARDVDAHAVGRDDARRLAVEVLARGDQPARDHAVAQDLLLAVDVVEVHLQRLDALRDAALQARPLGRRDDPRHQIERERPLLTRQRERDALVDERAPERLGAGREFGGVRRREFGEDALVGSADVALRVEHLVEGLGVAARGCCSRRRCLRAVWRACAVCCATSVRSRSARFEGSPVTCCTNCCSIVSAGQSASRFGTFTRALVT